MRKKLEKFVEFQISSFATFCENLALLLRFFFRQLQGYQLYEDANAGFTVLGLDISASDQEVTRQAYLYFAGAAVALIAALVVLTRK